MHTIWIRKPAVRLHSRCKHRTISDWPSLSPFSSRKERNTPMFMILACLHGQLFLQWPVRPVQKPLRDVRISYKTLALQGIQHLACSLSQGMPSGQVEFTHLQRENQACWIRSKPPVYLAAFFILFDICGYGNLCFIYFLSGSSLLLPKLTQDSFQ